MIWILMQLGCSSPQPTPAVELPPVTYDRPTTKPSRAMGGLDSRVDALQTRWEATGEGAGSLVDALGVRMSLTGKFSDLDRMFEVAGDTPVRARALLAVHRFDEALQVDPEVAVSVNLARQQELDSLEKSRRATLEKHPSTLNWQRLGDVLAAEGRLADADRAYGEALAAYRDVSPLSVADLQFRRGMLWGEGPDDPDRARALYTQAIERLPGFVRAHVHLAELEWQAGQHAEAISRVRGVVSSEDPEPGGKLAIWLEGEEADSWRQRTTEAYDALLERYPLAFADHAAEFFLAVGELDRARELAELNLKNRNTRRARALCEQAGCGS